MGNATRIRRMDACQTVTIATSEGSAEVINFKEFAGGILHVPSGAQASATLTFYTAPTESGTYTQLYDSSGAIELGVSAGTSVALPSELFGSLWFKIVASAVNATVDWELTLKG